MQGRRPTPVLLALHVFVLAGAAGGLLARGHIVAGSLLVVLAVGGLWAWVNKRDKDQRV